MLCQFYTKSQNRVLIGGAAAYKATTMWKQVVLGRKACYYTIFLIILVLSENCNSLTKHKHFLLPFLGLGKISARKHTNIQVAAGLLIAAFGSFVL